MPIKIYGEVREENNIVMHSFVTGSLRKAQQEIIRLEALERDNEKWVRKIFLIDDNFAEDIDITDCFMFKCFRTLHDGSDFANYCFEQIAKKQADELEWKKNTWRR